jgi:putative protease
VVLARECSLADIEKIQAAGANALPLEVFVHGALCVAYSGQCLTSESLGGRSANRGECAQACRLPYELIADGKFVSLGDKKYLLSPQDLAGLDLLPEIVRAGVASLKIEGRLKAPEYVASITRIYRQALDELRFTDDAAPPLMRRRAKPKRPVANMKWRCPFRAGCSPAGLAARTTGSSSTRASAKSAACSGRNQKIVRDGVILELAAPAQAGRRHCFDAGHPDEKEEGGRIYEMQERRVFKSPATS